MGKVDVFRLKTREIEQLEDAVWTLIQDGFTWQDAYTQCTLQNILVAFQRGARFSPRLCEDALGVSLIASSLSSSSPSSFPKDSPSPSGALDSPLSPPSSSSEDWSGEADAEIAAVLRDLLQSAAMDSRAFERNSLSPSSSSDASSSSSDAPYDGYYAPGDGGNDGGFVGELDRRGQAFDNGMDVLDSNKRDEFVQVHKYFDQSKGQLKRDPYLSDDSLNYDPFNFLTAFPQESLQRQEDSNQNQEQIMTEDNESYGPYAPYMTNEIEQVPEVVEDKGQYFDLPAPEGAQLGMESMMGMDDVMPADQTATVEDLYEPEGSSLGAEEEGAEGLGDEGDGLPLSLSPRDEATLEQLLEGSIEPDQLPVAQQKRLSHFIEMMIGMLEMQGTDHLDDVAVVEDGPKSLPPSEDNPSSAQEAASAMAESEEKMADGETEGEGEQEGEGEEDKEGGKGGMSFDPASLFSSDMVVVPQAAPLVGEEGMEMDKKSPSLNGQDEKNKEKSSSTETVDTHYLTIFLSGELDKVKAFLFLRNLTDILGLNSDLLTLDSVSKDKITAYVAPNPKWNSSLLADEAEAHKNDLQTKTGLLVSHADVGRGPTVQVTAKKNDGVVLTFVLVGSIAGVVLAVTIIYLLKRHRRSRDKLAQLAATADGNEASKDYQDLCRQRMQSKASEKPEPLHAASRIGSVSESQVRSPSSRSSTSSWSEEPAATNMDISTGHVVLSYMEDHLKNQDRLEQEWEALAAYQADPSSTVVASDPSNARKNRYTDVLPYDHSRVVLSAATNVSSSDYVNASFITDHDPRNPAYICTQGPLPHTVADFWQMVWEQGSVVIVMLTKLTENGTAMCHRYWPEEGSDLYHIYEVHLVSEHIWCDDYLVRSFYLKNLQTNETRTVTQFHFLTWPHLAVPPSMKALLDFRRKVNKSFRGGSCPIVVHCNDGCGRSGTYTLIDMVLNRMAKGAKEIDMAATLEHIRDQRINMVQTKEQFQFSLSAVAEEVHAILKAMPQ